MQFLESYKSVTIDSMAAAFDVSPSFLDHEVADFIVAGRLNAKIDKVAGIIETNRPDHKNALYQVRGGGWGWWGEVGAPHIRWMPSATSRV